MSQPTGALTSAKLSAVVHGTHAAASRLQERGSDQGKAILSPHYLVHPLLESYSLSLASKGVLTSPHADGASHGDSRKRATLPSRCMGNFEETILQSEKIPDSLNI